MQLNQKNLGFKIKHDFTLVPHYFCFVSALAKFLKNFNQYVGFMHFVSIDFENNVTFLVTHF